MPQASGKSELRQLEFTGERLVPELNEGQLVYAQHLARYLWVLGWAAGKTVLDVACGAGYGSWLLAGAGARLVLGIDSSAEAVRHASVRYRLERNLRFVRSDAMALPLPPATFDLAVSFETIEHLADPGRFVGEVLRVLKPSGVFIISTPNPAIYPPGNPFHVSELPFRDLRKLLESHFRQVVFGYQLDWISSAILSEPDLAVQGMAQPFPIPTFKVASAPPEDCAYFLAVCASQKAPLRLPRTNVLFADPQGQRAYIASLKTEIAVRDRLLEEALESGRQEVAKRDASVVYFKKGEQELLESCRALEAEVASLKQRISDTAECAAAHQRREEELEEHRRQREIQVALLQQALETSRQEIRARDESVRKREQEREAQIALLQQALETSRQQSRAREESAKKREQELFDLCLRQAASIAPLTAQTAELTTQLGSLREAMERLIERQTRRASWIKNLVEGLLRILQRVMPEPLRRLVRPYYLKYFYFRLFPERRTLSGETRQ